jgi:hypothetical protein
VGVDGLLYQVEIVVTFRVPLPFGECGYDISRANVCAIKAKALIESSFAGNFSSLLSATATTSELREAYVNPSAAGLVSDTVETVILDYPSSRPTVVPSSRPTGAPSSVPTSAPTILIWEVYYIDFAIYVGVAVGAVLALLCVCCCKSTGKVKIAALVNERDDINEEIEKSPTDEEEGKYTPLYEDSGYSAAY